MNVMGQPVEQRTGEPLGPQDRCPVLKGQVRCDDGGAALVALREHLEQELRSRRRQRRVAKFIAWLGRCRRLAKDWEATIASSDAWLLIASIRRTSRLIARA